MGVQCTNKGQLHRFSASFYGFTPPSPLLNYLFPFSWINHQDDVIWKFHSIHIHTRAWKLRAHPYPLRYPAGPSRGLSFNFSNCLSFLSQRGRVYVGVCRHAHVRARQAAWEVKQEGRGFPPGSDKKRQTHTEQLCLIELDWREQHAAYFSPCSQHTCTHNERLSRCPRLVLLSRLNDEWADGKIKVLLWVYSVSQREKNCFPEDLKSKGRNKMMKCNVFKANCDVRFLSDAGLRYQAYKNTET